MTQSLMTSRCHIVSISTCRGNICSLESHPLINTKSICYGLVRWCHWWLVNLLKKIKYLIVSVDKLLKILKMRPSYSLAPIAKQLFVANILYSPLLDSKSPKKSSFTNLVTRNLHTKTKLYDKKSKWLWLLFHPQ